MSKFLDGSGLSYLWTKIKNTFYTKTESDNKYALKTALDNYYNKTTSDNKYALKTALDNYYNKTTSDNKYALKTALDNYYQKTETYNQSEIDNLIAGVSGGEIDAYTKTESDNRYYQKSKVYTKTEADGRYLRNLTPINVSKSISSDTTYTVPAMEVNTTVYIYFTLRVTTGSTTHLYVKLPSGGTYGVDNRYAATYSGGSEILDLYSDDSRSKTDKLRIYRLS